MTQRTFHLYWCSCTGTLQVRGRRRKVGERADVAAAPFRYDLDIRQIFTAELSRRLPSRFGSVHIPWNVFFKLDKRHKPPWSKRDCVPTKMAHSVLLSPRNANILPSRKNLGSNIWDRPQRTALALEPEEGRGALSLMGYVARSSDKRRWNDRLSHEVHESRHSNPASHTSNTLKHHPPHESRRKQYRPVLPSDSSTKQARRRPCSH